MRQPGIGRLLAVLLATVLVLVGCSGPHRPTPTPSAAVPVDYDAVITTIETAISTGSPAMDNVRAVLVVVNGETQLAHYRRGFTADDHEHVWSVTKSVMSTLVGIAISEGLITSLDAPLSELLPESRKVMRPRVGRVTLRELMTMSGGFTFKVPDDEVAAIGAGKIDYVSWSLSMGQEAAAGLRFQYSNVSADLVAAVLHSALQRTPATKNQTILDYARTKLLDPLGILTRPAYESFPVGAVATAEFEAADFAWIAVQGVHLGALGLRLTAADMAKIGQLYLDDGMWEGKRLLPEGWVEQATTPSKLNSDYGSMWWVRTRSSSPTFAAEGSQGQRVVVVPDHHAVIVTLCATNTGYRLEDGVDALIDELVVPALG